MEMVWCVTLHYTVMVMVMVMVMVIVDSEGEGDTLNILYYTDVRLFHLSP